MISLSVNIDHVATLRNARGGHVPDPLVIAQEVFLGGAKSITMHLREDRRHVMDHDINRFAQKCSHLLNLEIALTEEMANIAHNKAPASCCIVPERRQELTTETGVDPRTLSSMLLEKIASCGSKIFLFIDPNEDSVLQAKKHPQVAGVELHTGYLCEAFSSKKKSRVKSSYQDLVHSANLAHNEGLIVHAGHGLHLGTTPLMHYLPHLEEVSIGHELIALALMTGIKEAVACFFNLLASQSSFPSLVDIDHYLDNISTSEWRH